MPGRLVVFRSDLIPHEVMPCSQPRWSLTGWFRSDAILGLPQAAYQRWAYCRVAASVVQHLRQKLSGPFRARFQITEKLVAVGVLHDLATIGSAQVCIPSH